VTVDNSHPTVINFRIPNVCPCFDVTTKACFLLVTCAPLIYSLNKQHWEATSMSLSPEQHKKTPCSSTVRYTEHEPVPVLAPSLLPPLPQLRPQPRPANTALESPPPANTALESPLLASDYVPPGGLQLSSTSAPLTPLTMLSLPPPMLLTKKNKKKRSFVGESKSCCYKHRDRSSPLGYRLRCRTSCSEDSKKKAP
jgi:hypothetical protein